MYVGMFKANSFRAALFQIEKHQPPSTQLTETPVLKCYQFIQVMILTFDNFINFSSEVWQKPAFFKTFESKAFDLVHFHRTISYHTIDLYNQGERAFLDAITETSQRHISPKIQLLPLSPTPCYVKKPI